MYQRLAWIAVVSALLSSASHAAETMVCQASIRANANNLQAAKKLEAKTTLDGRSYFEATIDDVTFQATPVTLNNRAKGASLHIAIAQEKKGQIASANTESPFYPAEWSKKAGMGGYTKLPNNPDAVGVTLYHEGRLAILECYERMPDPCSFSEFCDH